MKYREELTEEERGVLLALSDGDAISEIARDLGLKTSATWRIVDVLLIKLNAKSLAHAVALGYHHGHLVPAVRP